ncbi:MAG: PepSY-associated TM helix domain-containing protein [Pseudomonadota bacterium]
MKSAGNRNFWSRQFRQWHWISSALVLALMLMFGLTGLTLNHPDWFESEPQSSLTEIALSDELATALAEVESDATLSPSLIEKLKRETGANISSSNIAVVEFEEMIFDLSGPGVDANLTIDLATGDAFYERIDNGVIAKLNDLHKGRDTGMVWGLLIDITAVACVIFCLSGLGLLALNANVRASTWPLTTFGVVVPVIAYVLFVHT